MTAPEPRERPDGPMSDDDPGVAALRRATAQLRALPEPRVVEIADAVLQRVLAAPRRAEYVRATADPGVRVSTTALVAVLRADLDTLLPHAAVQQVAFDVDDDEGLSAVTIDLVVRYGESILDTADRARDLAKESLDALLGTSPVDVVVRHVHVSDVTVGDPHLVDPADEA